MTNPKVEDIDRLIEETREVLSNVDEQIKEIGERANYFHRQSPHLVRDKEGGYLITPLIRIKSECLSTLASLYRTRADE